VLRGDPAGALVLERRLVIVFHGAGDVGIDPERRRRRGMLRDAGVLADPEPESPAVDVNRGGCGSGAETLDLRGAQVHLSVRHAGTGAVDREYRDVDLPVATRERRPDEGDRARLGAGLDDWPEARVVRQDRLRLELVARQGQLREDDDARAGRPNRLGVDAGVGGHVARDDTRLGNSESQWLSHAPTA
jgi:hypothetical protein